MRIYKKVLLPILFFIVNIFGYGNAGAAESSKVHIPWSPAMQWKSEESHFSPSLYFQGGIFSDSLPQVPVYIKRIPNRTPHFSFEFSLEHKTVVPCTPEEVEILKAADFSATRFMTYTDTETTGGKSWSRFHIIPVRKHNNQYEKLKSFTLTHDMVFDETLSADPIHEYPENSVLSTGHWYRICVEKEGIYRLSTQNLSSMGVDVSQLDKSSLQVFGNGGGMLPESNAEFRYTDLQENAIWVSGSQNGNLQPDDYLLFYGQSPHRWSYNAERDAYEYQEHYYSDQNCYFLTYGQNPGKRVTSQPQASGSSTHVVTDFYDYAHHERNLDNIIESGKTWYGELFDVTLSRDFSFHFPHINTQKPVHINVFAAARSSSSSSFTIESFGQSSTFNIGSINIYSTTGLYARNGIGNLQVNPAEEQVNVRLTYNRTASGSRAWLNYITVNAQRKLIHEGSQMFFRNPSVVGEGHIAEYRLEGLKENARIWDISNIFDIREQSFQGSGSTAVFKTDADIHKEYVVFTNQDYLTPKSTVRISNQNLHAMQVPDLMIVVPDAFRNEAERLAQFRSDHDGLSVKLVSPRQIYNEFSSGMPDISAIRNFMKMFYDRARLNQGDYPRYLLLFGNGTYDNKNRLGYGGNFIPTFQTQESLSRGTSYVSDDFFGLLDDNEGLDAQGAIDLGIGRFPIRTLDEARFIVDKMIRYDQRIDGLLPGTEDPRFAGMVSNFSDWRNIITLVADDEDGNIHFNQSENLARFLDQDHRVFNVEKIYLDAYEQITMAGGSRYPEVNKAINNRVNQGALLINYIGHGGSQGLAHERILTFDDILSWGNFYNMPVFMTATCEFSSFDQPDANELSAGVRIFLKPDGGASALFTTTRLAYSHSNFSLNDAFMRNAFEPMENGQMPRLGDLIRIAKVESSSITTLKNFVLLGDPSMQLAYPKYKAITTHAPDTMRALEKITIKGEVHNPGGQKAENYNGIIYPTIYDKKATFSTLGNDPGSQVAEFTMQNKILYRGKASVTNGEFEFSFIIPRDISYNTGYGKISYYFDDGKQYDGSGYYSDFIISGTAENYTPDHTGPVIELFLNNRDFRSGDRTGPNPVLLAYLNDESGINTTGHIGHDIVAFLNDDRATPYILNSFYQADLDSYQSGRVVFPFHNLEKGEYTLTLRAWDVHNNVSSESIDFVVTSAPGVRISELLNFPNPFSDKTTFSIEHNKPASELTIRIHIYSLNGQLIKTIEENIYASGFNIPPIEWDGTDNGGSRLGTGIYLFRAEVSTRDGDTHAKTEKLMILR